jgi:hypothetical protein
MYVSVYINSGEVVPIGKIKKDYCQELGIMGHDGDYGLCELAWPQVNNGNLVISHNDDSFIPVRFKSDNSDEIDLYVEPGIEYLVCHPDWEVKTVNVHYRLSRKDNYKVIRMHNDVKTRSRYLFAFIISTTKDFFYIDPCGADYVTKL